MAFQGTVYVTRHAVMRYRERIGVTTHTDRAIVAEVARRVSEAEEQRTRPNGDRHVFVPEEGERPAFVAILVESRFGPFPAVKTVIARDSYEAYVDELDSEKVDS
jgi:hypothetical protein